MDVDQIRRIPESVARLLAKFIEEKLAAYVEPSKKGTPKGEPVGFSRTKYKATLITLRETLLIDSESLETQAKELGITYGLLRKWRSEKKFKDIVMQHRQEFFSNAFAGVRHRNSTKVQEARKLLKQAEHALADKMAQLDAMLLQAVRDREILSPRQREAATKILLAMQMDLKDQMKSERDRLNYERAALTNAIQILRDRNSAMQHRKEVVDLLEGVKEMLH